MAASRRQHFITTIILGAIQRIVHALKEIVNTLIRVMPGYPNANGEAGKARDSNAGNCHAQGFSDLHRGVQ